MKSWQAKNKEKINMSKETIIRALKRFGTTFLISGIATASLLIVPNFENFKEIGAWLYSFTIAFITGGIAGILKAISGYIKYDK